MKNKVLVLVFLLVLVSTVLIINSSFSSKETSQVDNTMISKNTIKEVTDEYYDGMWEYKNSIKKIVFEKNDSELDNYIKVFDISVNNDNSIKAYIVLEDGNNVLYIKGNEIIANSNSSFLFNDFTELREIENIEYLDTSNVTNMSYMFANCSSLIHLDLNSFKTNNVTSMSGMFKGCISLRELIIDSFDTSNVTDMFKMFYDCGNLKELNISSWNTENVIIMKKMFEYCSNLENIDINNWKTNSVLDISFMFDNCDSLKEIDLSNWDTNKVEDMRGTFANCRSLKELKNNFDMSNVKYIGYKEKTDIKTYQGYGMFYNTPNVKTTLNINNIIDNYEYAFENSNLDGNSHFTINYSSLTENMIDRIIESNSHVYKGTMAYEE